MAHCPSALPAGMEGGFGWPDLQQLLQQSQQSMQLGSGQAQQQEQLVGTPIKQEGGGDREQGQYPVQSCLPQQYSTAALAAAATGQPPPLPLPLPPPQLEAKAQQQQQGQLADTPIKQEGSSEQAALSPAEQMQAMLAQQQSQDQAQYAWMLQQYSMAALAAAAVGQPPPLPPPPPPPLGSLLGWMPQPPMPGQQAIPPGLQFLQPGASAAQLQGSTAQPWAAVGQTAQPAILAGLQLPFLPTGSEEAFAKKEARRQASRVSVVSTRPCCSCGSRLVCIETHGCSPAVCGLADAAELTIQSILARGLPVGLSAGRVAPLVCTWPVPLPGTQLSFLLQAYDRYKEKRKHLVFGKTIRYPRRKVKAAISCCKQA